jgi:hypothetical protein
MRPTTYSDGMTQVSVGVPQLRRIASQLPPLASVARLTNYASISVLATQKGKPCHWRNSGDSSVSDLRLYKS